ncbi:MAG: hypothetical protein LLG13_05835 [Bacteroidales bacterium]|nr:hypothetical protein [Bacteroidales bacterium]
MPDKLKMIVSTSFFLLIALKLLAPGNALLIVIDNPPVEPYKRLIHAIGMVETSKDTLAYNPIEEAVGFFQIRPIRVEDYNKRTGSNYTPMDMFNYEISEKIFLYYASQIGPYDFEQIARNWNGSGACTTYYWDQVKEFL